MLCDVCMRHSMRVQLVPDREVGVWRFDILCPVCFDEFLALFPLTPACFVRRETTGIPVTRPLRQRRT